MKMLGLTLAMAIPLFAQNPPAKTDKSEPLPQTEADLKKWLEGTKWVSNSAEKQTCVFRGTRFETPLAKPIFSVKGSRGIVMNWGKGVKVPCVLSDDCTTLSETEGLKIVYKFSGRQQR